MKQKVVLHLFLLVMTIQNFYLKAYQCDGQRSHLLEVSEQDLNSFALPSDTISDYNPVLVAIFECEKNMFWKRSDKRILRLIRNNPGCLANFEKVAPIFACAIERGRLKIIREMIESNEISSDLFGLALNDKGQTGLIVAAQRGHKHVVRYLAAHSTRDEIVIHDNHGFTALDYAQRHRDKYGDSSCYEILDKKIHNL